MVIGFSQAYSTTLYNLSVFHFKTEEIASERNSQQSQIHPIVDLPTIIIMVTGTVLKAILFLVCRQRKSPGAMVLAMDQRNDVLTNIVALAGAFIGNHYWLYADPLGAFFVWCVP